MGTNTRPCEDNEIAKIMRFATLVFVWLCFLAASALGQQTPLCRESAMQRRRCSADLVQVGNADEMTLNWLTKMKSAIDKSNGEKDKSGTEIKLSHGLQKENYGKRY